MQHIAASLYKSTKFLQPSLSNNLSRSPWDWSVIIKICSFESRSYTVETGQRHSSLCEFGQEDSQCKQVEASEVQQSNQDQEQYSSSRTKLLWKKAIGENISSRDKNKFLLNTLSDLKDSKEAVYSALDAWVAWENNFPLVSLKRALISLEKEEQWHRVVQVIKWMLSKGQGATMGTYEELIRALEKDHRAEEAHKIWVKKIGRDLHSVPWRVCDLMISIYYRNNMLERLVKLFKGLESFDRKPPSKAIVQKVADAYETMGLLEEKNRVLEKYNELFCKTTGEHRRKSRRALKKSENRADGRKKKVPGTSEDGSGSSTSNLTTEILE